jgi:hypothetical protein
MKKPQVGDFLCKTKMVTLRQPVYKAVVGEVIRWNLLITVNIPI